MINEYEHPLTILIHLFNDLLEALVRDLVSQHAKDGAHHDGTDASFLLLIESLEGFPEDYGGRWDRLKYFLRLTQALNRCFK